MDIEKAKEQIKNYLETHTHGEIMRDMYGDSVERMKSFDASLWKDAIANQVDFGDEELYYAEDNDPNKKYLPLFDTWSSLVDPKIPWQNVDECMFPTCFVIIEDNGKRLVYSIMVGQGSASTICSVENFKSWMNRCENKYTFDETKFITVDDLEKAFKATIEEYEAIFKE